MWRTAHDKSVRRSENPSFDLLHNLQDQSPDSTAITYHYLLLLTINPRLKPWCIINLVNDDSNITRHNITKSAPIRLETAHCHRRACSESAENRDRNDQENTSILWRGFSSCEHRSAKIASNPTRNLFWLLFFSPPSSWQQRRGAERYFGRSLLTQQGRASEFHQRGGIQGRLFILPPHPIRLSQRSQTSAFS